MREVTSGTSPASSAGAAKEIRGTLAAGSRLRSYELVSVIGQGAFGITYRARDTTLHRDVAIKEYLPTALALRESDSTVVPRSTEQAEEFVWGRERFLDEARTLARFSDVPAIVRVYDFLEANGTGYMVMALAQGDTLERRLRESGPLTPREVERILEPLLDGLEHVHEAGFLHRDIKPANLMLDARGNPTLVDFGAARAAMAGRSTVLTAIFTPGYAAIEQFTGGRQGPWTDIYGLAATLYHAITGEQPPSAVNRVLDDTYEPLAGKGLAGWPRNLLAGIDAGLAVRIEERPQSIADWRALLSGTAGGATVVMPAVKAPAAPHAAPRTPEPAAPAPSPVATAASNRRLVQVAAAGLAVIALAAGAWFAFAPKPQPTIGELQSLKAEDLERLLAERRAADAAAAEKKRLEDEARRKAETDAAAKQQADADLEKARQDRARAEAELAKLKADMEARRLAEEQGQRQVAEAAAQRAAEEEAQRKAEAEMAALRAAEEEAQRKAAQEAENKRKADEALARARAERQKADAEAREKEAVEARRKAEADALAAIRQYEADRKAADLKKAEEAKAKLEARRREEAEALAAIQKLEADQKKAAEERAKAEAEKKAAEEKAKAEAQKKADEAKARAEAEKKVADQKRADEEKAKAEAARKAAATTPPQDKTAPALDGLLSAGSFDGVYKLESGRCFPAGVYTFMGNITVRNGRFERTWTSSGATPVVCRFTLQPDGAFNLPTCADGASGKITGKKMELRYKGPSSICEYVYVRQ